MCFYFVIGFVTFQRASCLCQLGWVLTCLFIIFSYQVNLCFVIACITSSTPYLFTSVLPPSSLASCVLQSLCFIILSIFFLLFAVTTTALGVTGLFELATTVGCNLDVQLPMSLTAQLPAGTMATCHPVIRAGDGASLCCTGGRVPTG